MKCKNFFRGLVLCLTLLAVNTFAQDCVAIAHVIYDGNNLYYADNEANFKYKQLSKEDDGTFTICFSQERLEGTDRKGREDVRQLRFGSFCTEGKDSCASYLNVGHEPFLSELFPEYKNGVDSQQVFEVWFQINADGTLSTPSTTKPVIVEPAKKTIRFLAPWNNTGVVIALNGKNDYTTPVGSPYCGWFEYRAVLTPKDAFVYFKQTIGETYIGAEGLSKEPIPVEQEIRLDSVLTLSDTVWIVGSKYSEPELYTEYPGELGDCPIKKLPVMMFDWLHGPGDDAENRSAQAGTTSQDFGTSGCKGSNARADNNVGYMKGMVEENLGSNGVPVRAADFPSNCEYTEHLDNWFVPEVVATDAAGKSYTNATCRDLELTLTDDGFWLGQKNKDSEERGLFFLDDFQYLDSAKTVLNPMFDNINGGKVAVKDGSPDSVEMGTHNYGFTMKIQAQFEYVKGQYFEFLGDDDVWVFINNKLVVDIGGQHHAAEGHVDLDKLGLTEGETYPFHIFYAERHKVESNFKMRTSMDLKAEASMFLTDRSDDPKLIIKDVWQIVRETALACDFSASPEKQHTEPGPSNFTLYGKSLDKNGIALKTLDSAYYSGITVTNDFTSVTIDVKAITKAQALPPGNYYIRVRLKSNPDEYKDIPFTIEPYELPNLAFASVKDSTYFIVDFDTKDTVNFTEYWSAFGDSLSRDVSSDTLPINLDKNETMWAGRSYPVYVMYVEEWASIYSGISVKITTSTPNLVACDSMGNPITDVILMEGRAGFFIKATDEVVDGTLTLSTSGAKNKDVRWTKINIKVPPVPQIETAYIFDHTGDGRADSIWIKLNKPIDARSVIDSVKFLFEDSFDKNYKTNKIAYKADPYKVGDASISVTAAGDGFGTEIFTGGATEPYSGNIAIWYTYTDSTGKTSIFPVDGSLTDKVGPVIVAAEVKYLKDGNTQLTLDFSEGINDTDANSELFRFHCWKNSRQDSIIKSASDFSTSPANQWKMIFPKALDSDVVPAVGDSVRFMPPSQLGMALDLVDVGPHEKNPWVRITGEQKVTVTSPKVVSLSTEADAFDSARVIIQSKDATVPKLVTMETSMSADQVAAIYGTQGHYLGDLDMAELVENEIAEIVKAVQDPTKATYKNKDEEEAEEETGVPAKTYTLEEILKSVEAGEMSIKEAKKTYGLSEVIVDAYNNGLLTSENLQYYQRGTPADIQKIVSAVADRTELRYEAFYYSSLGHYVNRHSGTITCNDDIFKEGGKRNCLDSDGRLFLAWNMRTNNGRLASTGVYIARLIFRVKVNTKVIIDRTQDFLWGVRRGQINAKDLGL
ncbi:MAG: fibro-slime domain-containing protein [Fibrobacter sp.]|nr:fibro-slime domain-containing protein [Fibrobacter sp.]